MDVTLDASAIIALAKDEPDAQYLKPLRDYHRQGLITLSIGRTTSQEAMSKSSTEPPDIIAEKRIAAAGLNIDRVQRDRGGQSIAYRCCECNVTTFEPEHDFFYAKLIRDILTGNKKIDFKYNQYLERRMNDPEEKVKRAWHNHFNDIWGLVEHVAWGGDIFVTSDRDFLTKRDKLAIVVPGKILGFKETIEYLSKMSLPLPKPAVWQPQLEIQRCLNCLLKQQLAG